MERNTISNYGWVIVLILVLSVFVLFATPFGDYISSAIKASNDGMFQSVQKLAEKYSDDDFNSEGGNFTPPSVSDPVIKFSITYHLNGGTIPDNAARDYLSGEVFDLVPASKPGYEFIGYFDNPSCVGNAITSIKADDAENKVLYAKFVPITYSAVLNLNGGNGANSTTFTIESDNILISKPIRVGYTFTGWTGTGLSNPVQTITIEKGSVGNREYTANWQVNSYTARFELEDGSVLINTITKNYGEKLGELPVATKEGYRFDGWATSLGEKISGETTMPANNVVYYATWVANTYNVSYNGNGADSGTTASSSHVYDKVSALSANGFTKAGCDFVGWNTKSDGSGITYANASDVKNIIADGSTTLYAMWKGPFAVYSEDDNSLNFYNDIIPQVGKKYNGNTVTAVYSDIENLKITSSSKIPWKGYSGFVKTVDFVDDIKPINMNYWFYGMTLCTDINLEKLNSNEVTSFKGTFYDCASLTELDVTSLNTSKATSMRSMFNGCINLTKLDISNFVTKNVTDLAYMFKDNHNLSTIDVSGFETSKVTTMSNMFYGCRSVEELDVSEFDTSNTTDLSIMFYECRNLKNLDVSGFDTAKVTTIRSMFNGCSSLNSLDVSNFVTDNVTDMAGVFKDTAGLTELDVSNFNTAKVTNMKSMFYGCVNLPTVDVSGFDTSNVTDMSLMFYRCVNAEYLDVSGFNVQNVENMRSMFNECAVLKDLDVSNFKTTSAIDMTYMFDGCKKITYLDLSGFDTTNVTSKFNMLNNCLSLKEIKLSDKFHFIGDTLEVIEGVEKTVNDYFPEPSSKLIPGANGHWYAESTGEWFIPSAVPNNTEDAYYAVAPKQDFAIYSETDDSLVFYNREGMPMEGAVFNNKTASKIYKGVEDLTATSGSELPWDEYREEIKKVSFADEIKPTSTAFWFENMSNCTSINLKNLNTVNVTNMRSMFNGCSGLKSLDVSDLNTSNTTLMQRIFANCTNLEGIDVSNFDTSNVTRFDDMFWNCKSIETLDLTSLNTSKATSIYRMFAGCEKLKDLDVSSFNTSKVTNMAAVFYNCSSLRSVDVTNFNTAKVKNIYSMFSSCTALESVDVANFNTANVENMYSMFLNCRSLTELDLSSFVTIKVVSKHSMFEQCWNLRKVTFGPSFHFIGDETVIETVDGVDMEVVKNDYLPEPQKNYIPETNGKWNNVDTLDMYSPSEIPHNKAATYVAIAPKQEFAVYSATDKSLTYYNREGMPAEGSVYNGKMATEVYNEFIDIAASTATQLPWNEVAALVKTVDCADELKPTNMSFWFNNMKVCTSIDLSKLDTSENTSLKGTFYDCTKLSALELGDFNTSKVKSMQNTFRGCKNLEQLDVSQFDTSLVTTLYAAFMDCSKLKAIDVSGFDTSKVTTMQSTFNGCSSVEVLDVSNWDTSSLVTGSYLFKGCSSVKELDVSNWSTSKITSMSTMFYNCSSIKELDVMNFDTGKVTNMSSMFHGCSELLTLDVSKFNTEKVNDMQYMFANCKNLDIIDVSGFITKNVTNMSSMFTGCNKVQVLDVSGFATENVTSMYAMFNNCYSLLELNTSNFNTKNVTNTGYMFSNCENLGVLDVSGFETENVTNMGYMFNNCEKLEILDVSGFVTNNVTTMRNMFYDCQGLKELDVSGFNTQNATNLIRMFRNCCNITKLDLSGFDTTNVVHKYDMFLFCNKLSEIKVSDEFHFVGEITITEEVIDEYENVEIVTANVNDYFHTPDFKQIPGADGKWYNEETGVGYNPEDVPSNTAATYIAVPQGQAVSVQNKDEVSVYTITYVLNGGINPGSAPFVYTTAEATVLPTPTRTGYVFVGWYETPTFDGNAIDTILTGTIGNKTYYAKWQ